MAKGGAREGAGRKAGSPNKVTAEVKALAGEYGPDAVLEMAKLAGLVPNAKAAEGEQARIAALKEILDRAYGKPTQHVAGSDDEPPIQTRNRIEFVVVDSAKG